MPGNVGVRGRSAKGRARLLVVLLSLIAVVSMLLPSTAAAVMYGQPDGNGHPFVGLVVFYNAAGTPEWRCTGSLLSPTLFLTAGHCTEAPAARAQVWFSSTMPATYPTSGGFMGTPYPHPNFHGLILPQTSDVGVVVLDSPVPTSVVGTYGQLAAVGALNSLARQRGLQDVTFKIVGYGLQGVKPALLGARERYIGYTKVNNLTSALTGGWNIQLSSNPGNWSGGLCFGDSGGPVFRGNTNVIVAVNSFVLNSNCKGNGFSYRVDTTYAQSFINGPH